MGILAHRQGAGGQHLCVTDSIAPDHPLWATKSCRSRHALDEEDPWSHHLWGLLFRHSSSRLLVPSVQMLWWQQGNNIFMDHICMQKKAFYQQTPLCAALLTSKVCFVDGKERRQALLLHANSSVYGTDLCHRPAPANHFARYLAYAVGICPLSCAP